MSLFVAVLSETASGRWTVTELDPEDVLIWESIDELADALREAAGPVRVLILEQDDEYAVLARLDTADDELDDGGLRLFLSNGRAADGFPLAELVADEVSEVGGDPLADEDLLDPRAAHDMAPFGDPELLADLGVAGPELVELAVHPSTLPGDLLSTVCERIGCGDQFERLRA